MCVIVTGSLNMFPLSAPVSPVKRDFQSSFGGERSNGNPIGLNKEVIEIYLRDPFYPPRIRHATLVTPNPTPGPGTSMVFIPVSCVRFVIFQQRTQNYKYIELHPSFIPPRYKHFLKEKIK